MTSRRGRIGRARPCIFEALESRRHLSVAPSPWDGFVGPLPAYGNPDANTLGRGSGPTSELHAPTLTTGGSASYSFQVIYRDDLAVRVATIDSFDIRVYGPNGYERTAMLVSVDHASDGPVRIARYKVAPPGGNWDVRDNGRYRVVLRPHQVYDVMGNVANDGIIGEFTVQLPGAGGPTPPPIRLGVDVRDFGAIPNDGIDDTEAIQAAIDSLPVGNGVPHGAGPVGGVVLLPAGVFDISRTLMLHSGVTLRGVGHNTVIHDVSTDRNSSAMLLWSPYSHLYNIGVTVEHLSIYTRWTRGIAIDPSMTGGAVLDLRLSNLRISAFGTAIDLRAQPFYHTDIEDVEVYNPGSTALHMWSSDNFTNVERIRNFSVTGRARGGFRPETALVFLGGDMLVQGMTIKATGAGVLPLYVRGRATFSNLDIAVPAADVPGGFAVRLQDLMYGQFDRISGLGIGKRLRLMNANDVQVKTMVSDGSSNVLSHITSVASDSYLRIGNAIAGRLQLVPPTPPPVAHVPVPAPTNVIDATLFGVVPDDGGDDTAALQAAIDSLPRGNGVPGSGSLVGGIVQLPQGMINLSRSLKLPSGVWLRGHNNGTALRNETIARDRAVVELTSPYTHRANVGAGIIDLGIYTTGIAVGTDPTLTGELRDFRMTGVRFVAGGVGIDLRRPQVNFAHLERIVARDPGSTVIWLGRTDNSSTGNLVRALRISGRARDNFVPEKALFVYHGQTRLESGSIEETFTNVLPLYASGSLTMLDVYTEYPAQANNVAYVFDNVTSGFIDSLFFVDPTRQIHLVNGSNLTFGHVNNTTTLATLRDVLAVDGSSRVTIRGVHGFYDAGFLDHPRINVEGVYSVLAQRFVETKVALSGNILADPNMTDVSDTRFASWTILWGDTLGPITGTWAVETVGGEKRLRLTVLSNPNDRKVTVRVKLNVPASAIGRQGIGRWRVDGGGAALVWTNEHSAQFLARAMKSQTAMISPRTLRGGEEMWIDLPSAAGTYYIWKVGMVAV